MMLAVRSAESSLGRIPSNKDQPCMDSTGRDLERRHTSMRLPVVR
jgi:hypothetical protein